MIYIYIYKTYYASINMEVIYYQYIFSYQKVPVAPPFAHFSSYCARPSSVATKEF